MLTAACALLEKIVRGHLYRRVVSDGMPFSAVRNVVVPLEPLLLFRLMVALIPHADGGQHAHGFFLADLQRASPVVVWCGIPESSLDEFGRSQQHTPAVCGPRMHLPPL